MENKEQPPRKDLDFKTFLESISHIPGPSMQEKKPQDKTSPPLPPSSRTKETRVIHREPFMPQEGTGRKEAFPTRDKSGFQPEPISLTAPKNAESRREPRVRPYELIPHKARTDENEKEPVPATPEETPEIGRLPEREPAARQASEDKKPEKPETKTAQLPGKTEQPEPPNPPEPEEAIPPELPSIISFEQSDLLLRKLFELMVQLRASDLHVAPGYVPCLRILGDIYQTEFPLLSDEAATRLLLPLITDEQNAVLQECGEIDFAFEMPGIARFRANFYRQQSGLAASVRMIPLLIPTLEELKLPPLVKRIAQMRKGLVMVTGPTGSGKSTTLAAMINEINNTRNSHIITIEDPVEFVHANKTCLISHREVGNSASTYYEALRSALREDPDIIMVGEMRDRETIALAIKAAEMGLLVLATLHTNSAHKTIDRIIDVFPPEEQDQIRSMLADALSAVITQQLIKRADGQGRCAAVELLVSTPALPNLIREGKTSQIASLIQTGREYGMQNMDHALIELIRQNAIFPAAARELVTDPKTFERFGIIFDQA